VEHHRLLEVLRKLLGVVELPVLRRVAEVLHSRAVEGDTLVVEVVHRNQAGHSLADRNLVEGVLPLVEGNRVEVRHTLVVGVRRIPAVVVHQQILVEELHHTVEEHHMLQGLMEPQGQMELLEDMLQVQALRTAEEGREDSHWAVEEDSRAVVEDSQVAVEDSQVVEVPHNPDNHRVVGVEP